MSLFAAIVDSLSPQTKLHPRYATFSALAGVDPTDEKAAAAGLPPIDSLNLWPLISGANTTSPRTEVVLGAGQLELGYVQVG